MTLTPAVQSAEPVQDDVPLPFGETLASILWLCLLLVLPTLLSYIVVGFVLGFSAGLSGPKGIDIGALVTAQIRQPAAGFWCVAAGGAIFLFAGARWLSVRRFGGSWRESTGYAGAAWSFRIAGVLVAALVSYFIWAGLIVELFKAIWPSQAVMPSVSSGQAAVGLAVPMAYFALAILVPIAEEMAFRGYALARLRSVFPMRKAILICAIFFALAHFNGGLQHPVITFYLGLLTGWLRETRGSLIPGMILHGAVNSFAVFALQTH